MILCLMALLGLAACGGGGTSLAESVNVAATGVTSSSTAEVAASPGASLTPAATTVASPLATPVAPPAAPPAADPASNPAATPATTTAPATAAAPATLATPASPAAPAAPAANALPALQPPSLPRAGLVAADLAVLIAAGDPLSEAIGLAYQNARGIPEANMVRVSVPAGSDVISASDFAGLKAAIDAQLPVRVQATLVTWTQPSRVVGLLGTCGMGLTSALAFGYSAARCGGCNRTEASAYYDSDSTRPFAELNVRPSMMLGAATLDAAQALIARGVAADGSAPGGTGYLLRTSDAARSVRYTDYLTLPAAWGTAPGLALRYIDASAAGSAQTLSDQTDVLFYFTGLVKVGQLASNRFLPGAAADHLTSSAGLLPGGNGQMPATDWLAAGATASYGTVEEPCNHVEKFPRASVLIEHYLRGATLIEAYWKSVAWPGQGLFVGEPLARPWSQAATAAIEAGDLVVRTRSMRRNGSYRVDYRAAGASAWTMLASLTAGQPRPVTWRIPLPDNSAGGQLRWVGPCPTQTSQACVLGNSP